MSNKSLEARVNMLENKVSALLTHFNLDKIVPKKPERRKYREAERVLKHPNKEEYKLFNEGVTKVSILGKGSVALDKLNTLSEAELTGIFNRHTGLEVLSVADAKKILKGKEI